VYRANHAGRTAVKALAAVAVIPVLAEAANLASRALGVRAGAAVIVTVFAACWTVHRAAQLRHPAPRYRRAPGRDPEPAAAPALSEGHEPARLAA
jgi:hypothetical protein